MGRYSNIASETSFEEKLRREGGREFWKEESVDKEIPPGAPLTRVKGWKEVLEWVEKKRAAGEL